ncbi:hypothetical protein Ahy_B10g102430 [Arachis hypogaea]|uniref:Ubiquitin-like protease family profile domain-containing protein n=1 Tax=Arachis hypogaea TaxID=3818 RepID=A0A444X1Z2_ARAHY|nr:hypothetical protein Ahy_B10g102430 [Arachis hypogaea]
MNNKKIEKSEKLIYCLLPDIVNAALLSHEGKFIHPKTNKPFQIKDYQDYIPFLDKKKLASHPFIFFRVCYARYWWLWMADVEKKKFYVLDPLNKKSLLEERT